MEQHRYRVASHPSRGQGKTYYLGDDSRQAWDTYRLESARGVLVGRWVSLSRWNADALAGMGRWDTVQQLVPPRDRYFLDLSVREDSHA